MEENEQVVEAALANTADFHLLPVKQELLRLQREGELVWEDLDQLVSGNFLRTIPGVQRCDGFFAAILEKV